MDEQQVDLNGVLARQKARILGTLPQEPAPDPSSFTNAIAIPAGQAAESAMTGSLPGTAEATRAFNPQGFRDVFGAAKNTASTMLGIRPDEQAVRSAALRDPKIGREFYDEWLRGRMSVSIVRPLRDAMAGKRYAEELAQPGAAPIPVNPRPAEPNNLTLHDLQIARDQPNRGDSLDILRPEPKPAMPLPVDQRLESAVSDATDEVTKQTGIKPMEDPLTSRVFERVRQRLSQPEAKLEEEHPFVSRTARAVGSAGRMAGLMAATGPFAALTEPGSIAHTLMAATAFDAASQAQGTMAGSQPGWSPEQSALNLIGILAGSAIGQPAASALFKAGAISAETASRVAAAGANLGMVGAPIAANALKERAQNPAHEVDWKGLGLDLYQGLLEATLLSGMAPHLSPGSRDFSSESPEARLAAERTRQSMGGDQRLLTTLDTLEKAVRGGEQPPPSTTGPEPSVASQAASGTLDPKAAWLKAVNEVGARRQAAEVPGSGVDPHLDERAALYRIGERPAPKAGEGVTSRPVPDWLLDRLTRAQPKQPNEYAWDPGVDPYGRAGTHWADRLDDTAREIIARALHPEEEVARSRDARRAALAAGLKAAPSDFEAGLADALNGIERDMRNEPPGSAKRIYFASKDYIDRMADHFGITDPAEREMLKRHAEDLVLEPHRRAAKEGGFLRLGRDRVSEEERNRERNQVLREHDLFIEAAKDKLVDAINVVPRKLTGGLYKGNWLDKEDRGITQASSSSMLRNQALRFDVEQWSRGYKTLLKMTGNPATLDRAFTLAAELGPESGAKVAMPTLPEELRAPFQKSLQDYAAWQNKLGQARVQARELPVGVYEIQKRDLIDNHPLVDEQGQPVMERVSVYLGEQAPDGGRLVGGVEFYKDRYVHHAYERALREQEKEPFAVPKPQSSGNLLKFLGKKAPSSTYARVNPVQAWLERGKVSMDPTVREAASAIDNLHRHDLLNYLKESRPDLYLSKDQFEQSPDTHIQLIRTAAEKLPDVNEAIAAHKAQMAADKIGVYAGESGPLTKAMQRDRGRLSRELERHTEKMSLRKIPYEGMPDGFNPEQRGNRRRANEIMRAQARYRQLVSQLLSHANVERPDELHGVKASMSERDFAANMKLRELFDQKVMLENLARSTWVQVKGRQFGTHQGAYIRSDALRNIEFADAGMRSSWFLIDELTKTFKAMRVPFNPLRTIATQSVGNVLQGAFGGIELTPAGLIEQATGYSQMFKFLWSKEVPSDPLFKELHDAGTIQHAGMMFEAPQAEKEAVFRAFEQAKVALANNELGRGIELFTAGLIRAARWLPSEVPAFGKAAFMTRIADLAPMYAMYRQLRTGHGSTLGALEPDVANSRVSTFYDLSDVPRVMQRAHATLLGKLLLPTFSRFMYKASAGLSNWAMTSPPTVGTYLFPGLRLPQPFERGILDNVGTAKGRAYVVANMATNLALNLAKAYAHFAFISWYSAQRLGIDPNSSEYKRRKLTEAGGNSFRAAALIPITQRPNGDIVFWDAWNVLPGTAPLSIGEAPKDLRHTPNGVAAFAQWALSMNWIAKGTMEAVRGKDSMGREITTSRAMLNLVKNFLPGGIEMPLSAAYFANQPGAEKDALMALFQAVSGMTMRVAREGEQVKQDIRELQEGGHIKSVEQWMPTDAIGKLGLRRYNNSPFEQRAALERRRQRILDEINRAK